MADLLPPLPVDDVALDLYWSALHPGPEADRSSLFEVLDLYSRLAGSDPDAIEEVIEEGRPGDGIDAEVPAIHVMRDPQYHEHDLVSALIEEIRRLRGPSPAKPVPDEGHTGGSAH